MLGKQVLTCRFDFLGVRKTKQVPAALCESDFEADRLYQIRLMNEYSDYDRRHLNQ